MPQQTNSYLEPLEARIAPATTATVFGNVATFIGDAAADSLVLGVDDITGLLKHNRATAGDPSYVSDFDFNSFTPGVQSLTEGLGSTVNFTDPGTNDTLVIDGSARTAAETITVESGRIVALEGTQFRFDDSLVRVRVLAGAGADTFLVRSTGNVAKEIEVNGAGGDDTFRIGNFAASLDDIADFLNVTGGAGADVLIINDSGDTASGNRYLQDQSRITRVSGRETTAPVIYATGDLESVRLLTTQQGDVVQLDDSFMLAGGNAAFTVRTGAGEDTLFVEPSASTDIAIDGGNPGVPESDLLIIDQSGVTNLQVAVVGPPISGTVTGDNIRPLTFSGVGLPAITGANASGRAYTWLDADGDLVKLKVTSGTLSDADFTFDVATGQRQLQRLNLSDDGQEFAAASIRITARPTAFGGDGFVNVGAIDATGVNLGRVVIPGDIGQIDAGNNDPGSGPGIAVLKARSLGAFGTATQSGEGSVNSMVLRNVDKVALKTDLAGVLEVRGFLGHLKVGRNLTGAMLQSGAIPEIAAVVDVGGSIIGGAADHSGLLNFSSDISSLIVRGSVRGGAGDFSGAISARSIATVAIHGDIEGAAGEGSGRLTSPGGIDVLLLGGNLLGGSGENSGRIEAPSENAALGEIIIKGSIVSGAFATGIYSGGAIGSVAIGGDLLGTADAKAQIVARGPRFLIDELTIGSVAVNGNANHGQILAGVAPSSPATNSPVQVGRVVIGGDFRASDLVSGISPGADTVFGNADDVLLSRSAGEISSRIAKVVIRGQATGDPNEGGDSFNAIEAEQIGRVRVGARVLDFPGSGGSYPLGPFGDLVARELV